MALGIFGFAYITVSNQLLASLTEDLQDTALEFLDSYQAGGIKTLQAEIDRESQSHGDSSFSARYINATGQTLIKSIPKTWVFPLPEPDVTKAGTQWFEVVVNQRGELAKLAVIPTQDHGWIQIGLSLDEHEAQLQKIRQGFGLALLVIVVVGIMTGWWQVRRVLTGVDQIRRAAIDIGEGDFDRRLILDGHGQELAELADAFNGMLDRIQRLLGEMRDVSDNIAHDLRTPITRIHGLAEAGLMASADSSSGRGEVLGAIISECHHLTAMINTMLEIAQTDSGIMRLERKPVDMGELLHDACDLFVPVAEDAGIELTLKLDVPHLLVMGDKPRLQRLIANLVDNAIKFSSQGDRVLLTACQDGKEIRLFVDDTGMGISVEDMPHIFDRFYRSDQSRSTPGNGLGLSYAKSIAKAHGGDIHIDSQYGRGAKVTLILPME